MSIEIPIQRLLSFFIVLFLVITGVMVYWQVGQAQSLSTSPYKPCIGSEQPVRGTIYDRNGVKLAWSVPDPQSPCGWRREYATAQHPSISSFLGYSSYIYGSTGVEQYYNNVLMGYSSPQTASFDSSYNQFMNNILHQRVYGSDIYLSIDINIQDYIDKNFNSEAVGGTVCLPGPVGSIVVEDPRTGQILAMVSHPDYDANIIGDTTPAQNDPTKTVGAEYWQKISTDPTAPLINRALAGAYVPGSTFKTLTLIAALDSGKLTQDFTFNQDEASAYVINGFHINSNHLSDYAQGPEPPSFPMDLAHAYAYSDNVAFARVGVQVGEQTWLDYAKRFYMSTPGNIQSPPVDTDPPPRSYVYTNGQFGDVELATSAYGQGQLLLSPLTMTMIDGAVADDGLLATPHFLLKAVPHGTDPATTPNADFGQPQRVMSSGVATYVRKAMRDVVNFGSIGASGGVIAAIGNQSPTIGAKTGTGELAADQSPHAWLISLAPDDISGNSPAQLAAVVMKEHGGEGACKAPIAGKIFSYAIPIVSKYPGG